MCFRVAPYMEVIKSQLRITAACAARSRPAIIKNRALLALRGASDQLGTGRVRSTITIQNQSSVVGRFRGNPARSCTKKRPDAKKIVYIGF